MKAEQAVIAILEADSDVVGLIGGAGSERLHVTRMPQDKAIPDAEGAVVIRRTDQLPEGTKDGASTLDEIDFEIEIYAKSHLVLEDLSDKIRTALDRTTGTYAGIKVQSIRYDDSADDFDDEQELHQRTDTYIIREDKS